MIFKQWEQVLDGSKTQTRRPVKEGETYHVMELGPGAVSKSWLTRWRFMPPPGEDLLAYVAPMNPKWVVGRTYAVQRPDGRTVGRFLLTKIRRERLEDISDEDCLAEGIARSLIPEFKGMGIVGLLYQCPICPERYPTVQEAYACLWEHVYGKGAWDRMKDDDVWVLDFEFVEKKK